MKPITRNATAAILQLIISSAIMFVLYRYILKSLGVESLGVWSVVLATVSASRMAEFGISASITRFVAKYLGEGRSDKASYTIETAFISVTVLFSFLLPVGYLILKNYFYLFLKDQSLIQGLRLLPFAFISLFLTVLSGIFQSGLEGCQRYDLRAYLVIGAQFVFFVSALMLTSNFGLIGLAWAQIVQGCILLVIGWVLLRSLLPSMPTFPKNWKRVQFSEIFSYGIQFQIGQVSMMFFDPITKILLSKFGGIASTGYYEMASQFVLKARALVVSANQILVPLVANNVKLENKQIYSIYEKNILILWLLIIPINVIVISVAPLLSIVWIGQYESRFAFYVYMLSFAWFLNALNVPSYFFNLGSGHIFWNTISHVWVGSSNLVLSIILGYFFGANGVIFGMIIALVTGSWLVVLEFHKRNKIPISVLVPYRIKWIFITFLILLVLLYFSIEKLIYINSLFLYILYFFLPFLVILFFSLSFYRSIKFNL